MNVTAAEGTSGADQPIVVSHDASGGGYDDVDIAGVNVNVREDTPAPSLMALDVYLPGLLGTSPPISLQPTLSPETASYSVTVPAGTSYVTVEARAASGFRLEEPSSPPDADPGRSGYQVRLEAQVRPPSPDRADKPGTSAAVGERFLEVVGDEWSGSIIVASSENFPDGLAAASLPVRCERRSC